MSFIPKHRRSVHSMKCAYDGTVYRIYGLIERFLVPKIDIIIHEKIAKIPNLSSYTAIEYACGSGILALKELNHQG